jgi:hypothetical protein
MALLDDLLLLGLPAADDGNGGIMFTRRLQPPERAQYQAVRLKYADSATQSAAFAKRPDLAQMLDAAGVTITAAPHKNNLQAEYANAIDTLTQIRDAASPTNAQVIAAVKYEAKVLLLLLKLIARIYRADNQGLK